jgi:hypothetical protein
VSITPRGWPLLPPSAPPGGQRETPAAVYALVPIATTLGLTGAPRALYRPEGDRSWYKDDEGSSGR